MKEAITKGEITPSMWSSFLLELTPEEMVETMLRYGYRATELSDEHAKVLLQRGDPDVQGAGFRRFCNERGFSVPQGHLWLHCDLSVGGPAEKSSLGKTFDQWFRLFSAVGVEQAVLHPASPAWDAAYFRNREAWENTVENLSMLLELSAGMPFTLCLENLPVSFRNLTELERLISAIPGGSRFGICLDTGHLALNHGDCAAFIRAAGPRLKALHITDCVDCPAGEKHDHLLPTTGNIDWAAVIRALREVHYTGLFNFEVPRERNVTEAIRYLKLEYSRRLAEELLKL